MLIIETEAVPLDKFRTFIKALDALKSGEPAKLMVDDTNGNITVQLSVGNDHSCLALKSKTVQ